ncbi:MAG: hypothetical protein VKJ06_05475 [Vampirovibrionales bacterium]|nr:hypothetical protein [Vampirovibrionales bacterium]
MMLMNHVSSPIHARKAVFGKALAYRLNDEKSAVKSASYCEPLIRYFAKPQTRNEQVFYHHYKGLSNGVLWPLVSLFSLTKLSLAAATGTVAMPLVAGYGVIAMA